MTFARLLREADRNRPGAALSLAMVHRLNIIPLRIQHKSGIVTGMIVSFAGRAVITSAMGQRRMVKASTMSRSLARNAGGGASQFPAASGLRREATTSSSASKYSLAVVITGISSADSTAV
nr:Uncharacterised protein [Klebsiella pneumoniae]